MPRPRRLYAVLLGCALVAVPGVVTATPATAAATSVALVGDLQSELGCSADWQPECAATELAPGRRHLAVPGDVRRAGAATWNFKVALNDSWDVNYGARRRLQRRQHPAAARRPGEGHASPTTTPRTW